MEKTKINILIIEDDYFIMSLIIGNFFKDKRVKSVSNKKLEELIIDKKFSILSYETFENNVDSDYEVHFDIVASLEKAKQIEINNSKYDFIIMDYNIIGGTTGKLIKTIISSGYTNPIIANTNSLNGHEVLVESGAIETKITKSSSNFANYIIDEFSQNKKSA